MHEQLVFRTPCESRLRQNILAPELIRRLKASSRTSFDSLCLGRDRLLTEKGTNKSRGMTFVDFEIAGARATSPSYSATWKSHKCRWRLVNLD